MLEAYPIYSTEVVKSAGSMLLLPPSMKRYAFRVSWLSAEDGDILVLHLRAKFYKTVGAVSRRMKVSKPPSRLAVYLGGEPAGDGLALPWLGKVVEKIAAAK